MKHVIDRPRAVNYAIEAIKRAGLTPARSSIRGGTDGSRLSYMGLPCPNLSPAGTRFTRRWNGSAARRWRKRRRRSCSWRRSGKKRRSWLSAVIAGAKREASAQGSDSGVVVSGLARRVLKTRRSTMRLSKVAALALSLELQAHVRVFQRRPLPNVQNWSNWRIGAKTPPATSASRPGKAACFRSRCAAR